MPSIRHQRDAVLPGATPGPRSGLPYALTPLQEGMLLHALSAPASGVDVEQVVVRSRERWRVADLQRAWRETLASEPMLRTRFLWTADGRPAQQDEHGADMPWRVTSWRGLDAA